VDDHLVVRAQAGELEAFAQLADALYGRCYAVAMRLLRDSGLAQDATQQALVNIWRDLTRLHDTGRFDAWSYRVLVRACYAEYRRAPRWMPAIEAEGPGEPVARDELKVVIDRDQLERGFRRLSMDHRAVVVLHHFLDLPLEQVADVLGLPVGTVKSRLHRALAEMRASLQADGRTRGSLPSIAPGTRPATATRQVTR
jgi:RNA polymerase sigma-70 factor (ECF subfamily)